MPPSTQHAELNTSEGLLAQNEEAELCKRDRKHRSMYVGMSGGRGKNEGRVEGVERGGRKKRNEISKDAGKNEFVMC